MGYPILPDINIVYHVHVVFTVIKSILILTSCFVRFF